jgi:hypothetical protein
MTLLKKVNNRFLVYIVFAVTCFRMAVARVWQFGTRHTETPRTRRSADVREGLLLRVKSPFGQRKVRRHYALELTGSFPYMRVLTVARRAVVMPAETAALSEAASTPFHLEVLTSPFQVQKAVATQPAALSQFIIACNSCTNCQSCTSCSSCTCGCSSCSTCVSCGSCSTCGACSSCGPCTSCTSCASCGPCTSCAGCGSCTSCFGCSSCFCDSTNVLVC